MSTRLYFRFNEVPDWSRGEGDTDLGGTTRNWTQRSLSLSRGGAANTSAATSVTGPTSGLETGSGSPGAQFWEWISEPLDRDVTVSGSITANLWGSESSMNANAGLGYIIERLNGEGARVSTIVQNNEVGTELGTAAAVRNEASTPTSTAMLKGERFRVRVYFDDAVGTTMASGFTLIFRCAGDTAGADGDSYIEFTENFGFLVDAPGTAPSFVGAGSVESFGTTAFRWAAQQFVMPGDGTVTTVTMSVGKQGSPTDNLELALQADSSGEPSGTDLASASVAGSGLGSATPTEFNIADTALSGGQRYWLVLRRSSSLNDSNFYIAERGDIPYESGSLSKHNGSAWVPDASSNALEFSMAVTWTSSTLFLTNTASDVDPNGSTHDAKEAWTSRGGGVQQVSRAAVNGPTAPLLQRTLEAGNYLEWFTKQLQAFTLSGMVACNIRANQVNAATNSAVRVELAVCNSDGTNPVIWGASNDGAETSVGEAAAVFSIAGDDTSVAEGKRLRIRVYFDDGPGLAMASGFNVVLYYAGTSAGASGDTYVVLPQAVSEFSSGGANVTPTTVSVTTTINASTTSGAASHTTTTVSGTTTVSSPTSSAGASVTPTTVAATTTIPTPVVTVAGDANVTPTTVQSVVSNPAPAVVGNANAPPSTVAALAAIDTPTVQVHVPITTTSVATAASVPTSAAAGSASITTTTVAGSTSIPTPTVTGAGDAAVTPTTVAAATSVPTPSIRADRFITLSDVSATTSVPTPDVFAGGAGADITFLDPPTGVTVTAINGSTIRVSWNSVTGATKYTVTRNGVAVGTNITSSPWDDTSVPADGAYAYRVRGVA